jgi:hypothetical protein
MSPTRKTWIWIIVGVLGVGLVALIVVAGAGVYFITSHVHQQRASSGDALRSFEQARAKFGDQKPLVEVDAGSDQAKVVRRLEDIPTSQTRPQTLAILAWDPDESRVVRVDLPFWLLRMGRRKIDLFNGNRNFDLDRLSIDVNDLDRIGPALVCDIRGREGQRVLVWTQ